MIRNRILLLLFRLVVGGVFIYSGILKIVDPLGFAQNIMNYRGSASGPLPSCGPSCFPGWRPLAGLGLVSGIPQENERGDHLHHACRVHRDSSPVTMIRGLNVDCGCFGGTFSRRADWRLLVEDTVLLFMVSPARFERCPEQGIERGERRSATARAETPEKSSAFRS